MSKTTFQTPDFIWIFRGYMPQELSRSSQGAAQSGDCQGICAAGAPWIHLIRSLLEPLVLDLLQPGGHVQLLGLVQEAVDEVLLEVRGGGGRGGEEGQVQGQQE